MRPPADDGTAAAVAGRRRGPLQVVELGREYMVFFISFQEVEAPLLSHPEATGTATSASGR
jgi:hypothetical protein